MRKAIKMAVIAMMVLVMSATLTGCYEESAESADRRATRQVGNTLKENQPTPTDIMFSLERHNLIRRTYWVNGQRERALSIPNPIANMPLGYIVLFAPNGGVVGRFEVDGKVTSLNSFLAPYSESYMTSGLSRWLPDVDGAYGENDAGIFFFTPDGRYIEWSGVYLFSDIPFIINDPIVRVAL
jgi:hypothetical protein